MNFSDLSLINVQNPLVVSNGLTGYWSFNDGSSRFSIRDYSGNGNMATSSATLPTWVNGMVGSCVKFSSVNQVIQAPSNAGLRPASVTLCCWLNSTSYAASYLVPVAKPSGITTYSGFALVYRPLTPNQMTFTISSTAPAEFFATSSAQVAGVWQHWAGTFDNTTKAQSLYLNGVLQQSITTNITLASSDTYPFLMGQFITSLYPFAGMIDEVRLYNRAITAAEVNQLYLARGT